MTPPTTRRELRVTRRWRPTALVLISAALALAGLLALLYPTTSAWLTSYNQSKLIGDYVSGLDNHPVIDEDALQKARDYNARLTAGAKLEADANVPTGAGEEARAGADYRSLLVGPADVLARLRVPAIDVDLPVYHGTADETLLRGAGHLRGTSLPVGGAGTHAVITAHRGLASATMFTNLDRVAVGDTFTIEVFGETLAYEVTTTEVVAPSETEGLYPDPDRDLVTLVTCTPLGINTHRILVTGERVFPTPQKVLDAAGSRPDIPRFPWWMIYLAAGMGAIGLYVWRAGYDPAPRG